MSHYQKLMTQLSQLMQDQQVAYHIDQPLALRAHKIMIQNTVENKRKHKTQNLPDISLFDDNQQTLLLREITAKLNQSNSNDNYGKAKDNGLKPLQTNNEFLKVNQFKKQSGNQPKLFNASSIKYITKKSQNHMPLRSKQKLTMQRINSKQSISSANKINQHKERISISKQRQKFNNIKQQTINNHCSAKTSNFSTASTKNQGQGQKRTRIMTTEPSIEKNKSRRQKSVQSSSLHHSTKQLLQFDELLKNQLGLNQEKLELENQIKQMYEMIEKEKQAQNKMKENIEKLDENIKKSVNNQKMYQDKYLTNKKKKENYIEENRKSSANLEKMIIENHHLFRSIQQQRYLITTYIKVIEQIKSQLKIEGKERNDIKRQLNAFKNQQKFYQEKHHCQSASSLYLSSAMNESLRKIN